MERWSPFRTTDGAVRGMPSLHARAFPSRDRGHACIKGTEDFEKSHKAHPLESAPPYEGGLGG